MRALLRKITPAKLHLSEQLKRRVLRETGGHVLGGPFKGMRYTEVDPIGRTTGSGLLIGFSAAPIS